LIATTIEFEVPDEVKILGTEIYHAVFTGNVRSYKKLVQWCKTNPMTNWIGYLSSSAYSPSLQFSG